MAATKKELKRILFAHSAGPQYGKGKGSYDLVRWLKKELSGEYEIHFPVIEKPSSPTYEKFKKLFAAAFSDLVGPVVLIGHSLGGSTLLKYLSEEQPNITITGLFLVATPYWDSSMKEFQLKPGFQTSLKNIPEIFLYHSRNDPEVPFNHMELYAALFKKAATRALPGKEHIFSKGLPALVQDLKTL